jgi:HlyD family secretion protein
MCEGIVTGGIHMTNIVRLTVLLGVAAFGQEAVVQKSTIWLETVKRGDMTRAVRGLGVLTAGRSAEVSVPETQAEQIRPGQAAQLDTRNGLVRGKVIRVAPGATNGLVKVDVQVEGALPSGAVPGITVDGTIEIDMLKDVIYVGRPVMGAPQSEGTLFKVDTDRQHVTKVNVQYGQAGAKTIEVRSGLQPGDQVILSDMSAFATKDRIRLE